MIEPGLTDFLMSIWTLYGVGGIVVAGLCFLVYRRLPEEWRKTIWQGAKIWWIAKKKQMNF